MVERVNILEGAKNGRTGESVRRSALLRAKIVTFAMQGLDAGYVNGGVEAYKGSDCANFGITPYKQAGLIDVGMRIPHEHKDWMLGGNIDRHTFRKFILRFAEEVEFDKRQSADLVTFVWNGVESHVGIITQTNPDWFIHQPSGEAVKLQRLMQATSLKSVYRHKKILELERNGR